MISVALFHEVGLYLKGLRAEYLTKVHLVKAMVSSVVMYGCESWTVEKPDR